MQAETYDVTGVTAGRDYVPLAAQVDQGTADELGRQYSETARYSAVLVKVARTGQVTATYVRGERQPS